MTYAVAVVGLVALFLVGMLLFIVLLSNIMDLIEYARLEAGSRGMPSPANCWPVQAWVIRQRSLWPWGRQFLSFECLDTDGVSDASASNPFIAHQGDTRCSSSCVRDVTTTRVSR